jgi:hypothetical protein
MKNTASILLGILVLIACQKLSANAVHYNATSSCGPLSWDEENYYRTPLGIYNEGLASNDITVLCGLDRHRYRYRHGGTSYGSHTFHAPNKNSSSSSDVYVRVLDRSPTKSVECSLYATNIYDVAIFEASNQIKTSGTSYIGQSNLPFDIDGEINDYGVNTVYGLSCLIPDFAPNPTGQSSGIIAITAYFSSSY